MALKKWRPPEKIGTLEWNEKYRQLSLEESPDHSGPFDTMNVPWVRGMMRSLDDPNVWKVVNMKCSQQAWTSAVVVGYIMKRIDVDPCNIIIMFAKEREYDQFIEEKLAPAVRATPRLHGKIDVSTTRKAGNKKHFRKFPGGFLKLVGSNSPSSGKSSTIEVAIVEEPDDANKNVKGQGDSIKNLEERTKQVENRKVVYGGTSTIDGLSAIQDAYEESDKCQYFIPCHDCGESHVLSWDNVSWDRDSNIEHQIYGRSRPETAFYSCPHCGSIWDDDQRWQNVQAAEFTEGAGWKATAEFRGIRGHGGVSELYMANNHNSRLERLVERYLEAQHKKEQGEIDDWISFVNNCWGQPFKYEDDSADAKTLEARAIDYPENTVPAGGLLLTVGVDVQDDRFAIWVSAWGRGEESWLVYWGEVFGKAVKDKSDPVWLELEKKCFGSYTSENGYELFASAVSIDASDGGTNDMVYDWVRRMQKKYAQVQVMAIKGSSDSADKEIFSTPSRSIDHKTPTKATRYGLKVFIVGTQKSKDLFYGRLQLTGNGPGRCHWYESVRKDFYDQLTSEIKAPSRRHRGRLIWQGVSGKRREAPDSGRYALHASRAIRVHLKTPAQWDDIEHQLQQKDLFSNRADSQPTESATTTHNPYGNVDLYGDSGGNNNEWYG